MIPKIRLWRALIGVCWAAIFAAANSGVAADNVRPLLQLSAPVEFQIVQRQGTNGVIPIEGQFNGEATQALQVEVRLRSGGNDAPWQSVAVLPPGTSRLSSSLRANSGGWYAVEVRVRNGEATVTTATVSNVGVGEIFVITGQSNSANHGEGRQRPRSGLVAVFHNGKWRLADDPQPGASGNGGSFIPAFGDAMAERFKVPIGIVAAGVGATSVREWLPAGRTFPNPPTLTGNVSQRPDGTWESKGGLYRNLVSRMRALGTNGFRAVLWHQGESDANQKDSSRTLSGERYTAFLTDLIQQSQRDIGWKAPWFVAQASYHTPDDTGSPEIRAAQRALWTAGVALEGPDTDALAGPLRDSGGRGVHFSAKGLQEHGVAWAQKVSPWLERQLAAASGKRTGPPSRLAFPDMEELTIEGRRAFIFHPPAALRTKPQPWIIYAPTLPAYPDQAERWMHEQFLQAGIAVAGIDVGEAYGSPKGRAAFDALYAELTTKRGFAGKPCLFGRSRGGLWVTSWAIANPERVAGIIGIYPVFDFRTYPGLKTAAPAYGLTPSELEMRLDEFNPVARVQSLAKARIPITLIHGDVDKVVPLKENSAEVVRRYREAGAESLVKLIVLEGQGHNFFEGFFRSQALVDFAIERARAGAK